jgi:hypothetical protein
MSCKIMSNRQSVALNNQHQISLADADLVELDTFIVLTIL